MNLLGDLDEQRTGAAGGIANAVAGLGRDEQSHEAGNFRRGEEFAAFLAALRGEAGDEVFVTVSNDIEVPDSRGAEVEARVVKVGKQVFETSVSIFCFAQTFFVVERDGVEDSFEFGLVCIFDIPQRLVDEFAEVVGIALTVEAVEIAASRELETLAIQATLDHFRLAGELFFEGFAAFLDEIGEELKEEEGENIVLVLIGRHDAAKGIAGFPDDVIDFVLIDGGWLGHGGKYG